MINTETDYITSTLHGNLSTDTQGIRNLLDWYATVSVHFDTTIYVCCRELDWLDANLAALWSALIYKLEKENNLQIKLDHVSLASRFSILIRNGFSTPEFSAENPPTTFIRNASFGPTEEEAFSDYITGELMQQSQIKNLSPEMRGLLEPNVYELYSNVFKHAGTADPFFVCGQHYPKRNELVISLVDLGQSFLPPIHKCTNGAITTQEASIEWALEGNSELGRKGGGHALKSIKNVFIKEGHALQIVTGNAFWNSSYASSIMGAHRTLAQPMPGTMVSFIFKTCR
jgi:hypothetical protein